MKEDSSFTDSFGRRVSYLRVSVTDRCNLRCWYCMPETARWLPKDDMLSYEELLKVVRVGAGLGISKVRLTGGEPLVRKDLPSFVRVLAGIEGIREIALTTNGTLLARMAPELGDCGLTRINISLDTLDAERYKRITRGGKLEDVIAGIDAAVTAGFRPVKLNTVLQRDMDIADICALIEFAGARGAEIRFIELMPLLNSESLQGQSWDDQFISADEIKRQLGGMNLQHVEFLSPVTRPFCSTCNRLRLTSDGKLLACLSRGGFVDIRKILRNSGDSRELRSAMRRCIALKPEPWAVWGRAGRTMMSVSAIGA